jgi:hypothetical protein
LIVWGFIQASVTMLYSGLAVRLALQLQHWVSPTNGYVDKLALILLLGISGLIVGLLILARPAYLLLKQQLRDGFVLLLSTIFWLVLMLMVIFIIVIF